MQCSSSNRSYAAASKQSRSRAKGKNRDTGWFGSWRKGEDQGLAAATGPRGDHQIRRRRIAAAEGKQIRDIGSVGERSAAGDDPAGKGRQGISLRRRAGADRREVHIKRGRCAQVRKIQRAGAVDVVIDAIPDCVVVLVVFEGVSAEGIEAEPPPPSRYTVP